ncbi:MAG TPA: hypothetical protein VMF11_04040 [Candidatus Baltobacteraceae bacterium]|nr:hypothetical protein [Candidatus Baltobacteraceae bacterium]
MLGIVAIIAALALGAPPAQAQNSPIHVGFVNTTPACIWVTMYKRDASGIGGTLAGPVIISGNRAQTGPREVKPKTTFTFVIPRTRWIKFRVETMNPNCHGNTGGDTSMQADVANIDALQFTLHQSGKSYWLTRP